MIYFISYFEIKNFQKGREINHHGKLIKVGEDKQSTAFRRSEGI